MPYKIMKKSVENMRYSLNNFRQNFSAEHPEEVDKNLVNPHQLLNEDNPFC